MTIHNIAGMGSLTEGDSDLVLSSTLVGFISFEQAGLINGEKFEYSIRNGIQSESGLGTYSTAGPSLTNRTPYNSTDSDDSVISIVGNSRVFVTALKENFPSGWMPYSYPDGYSISGTITNLTIAANGGSLAVPISIAAPMSLKSVSIWSTDSDTARTWGWDLYRDNVNDELLASNSLTRYALCSANETFTPSAASTRTITSSTTVRLSPGLYWIVIQNRHASNAFNIGAIAANAFAPNTAQTKTTTNPNGATLDFVAVTWTKVTAAYCVRLNGEVFGGSAAF